MGICADRGEKASVASLQAKGQLYIILYLDTRNV